MPKSIYTPEYDAIRAELRAVRKAAGLSQRALARRLSVPHSWVAKVESGDRRIDIVEFCQFVSACAADPVVVLGRLALSSPPAEGAPAHNKRGRPG